MGRTSKSIDGGENRKVERKQKTRRKKTEKEGGGEGTVVSFMTSRN